MPRVPEKTQLRFANFWFHVGDFRLPEMKNNPGVAPITHEGSILLTGPHARVLVGNPPLLEGALLLQCFATRVICECSLLLCFELKPANSGANHTAANPRVG